MKNYLTSIWIKMSEQLTKIMGALKKAHASGNKEHATRLASMYKKEQAKETSSKPSFEADKPKVVQPREVRSEELTEAPTPINEPVQQEVESLTVTKELTEEGRPIYQNQWGDKVTERSVTVGIDDKYYNIPTVYDGKFVSEQEAVDRVKKSGMKDPITGRALEPFSDIPTAVEAAKTRSKGLGKKINKEKEEPMSNIDTNFLKEVEGFETKGYVPKVGNKSGVTIASGLDLGQQSEDSLREAGLDDGLIAKLSPYLGTQGQEAKELLKSNPLEVSEEEANTINNKVKQFYVDRIAQQYNGDSNLDFDTLPEQVRTAIVSVLFQYGKPKAVPKFWKAVTEGAWDRAVEELEDFKDDFGSRRKKEAELIKVSGILGEQEGGIA